MLIRFFVVCVALLLSIRRKLRPSGGIQQSTQKGFPSSLAIGGRGRVYSSLFLLIYMYKFCLTIGIEMIKKWNRANLYFACGFRTKR